MAALRITREMKTKTMEASYATLLIQNKCHMRFCLVAAVYLWLAAASRKNSNSMRQTKATKEIAYIE